MKQRDAIRAVGRMLTVINDMFWSTDLASQQTV